MFHKIARRSMIAAGSALVLFGAQGASAMPLNLRITVENLAPSLATMITPLWFGFHDGTFDLFNSGEPASEAVERIAEDGNPGPLVADFNTGSTGRYFDGVVFGPGVGPGSPPIFGPGGSASLDITVNFGLSAMAYFSYASMVIPSNDAFIGNGNPTGISLFDGSGNFLGADFTVFGSQVWDAGTEVNDEIFENTAALGQTAPNTGVDENGVVTLHSGFITGGNILTARPNADFTQTGYEVARIRVEQIPEPATGWLLGAGLIALGMGTLRRKPA